MLRRKRFSRAFLDRHGADLLAKARLEYSQHVAAGGEVRNPAGWIIHCAPGGERRTCWSRKAGHRKCSRIDNGVAFANESATPEEEVLTSDRYRQLQAALDQLPHEERKVIALAYFEDMSVREVGRTLKWDKCKADRRHRAALERLKDLLGVTDIDALQIEIGIIAWASIGAGAAHGGCQRASGRSSTASRRRLGAGRSSRGGCSRGAWRSPAWPQRSAARLEQPEPAVPRPSSASPPAWSARE